MLPKKIQPRPVTAADDSLRRAYDVGEKHRREHAIAFPGWLGSGQQLFDLVDDPIASLRPPGVVHTRKFDEMRAWNMLGQISALFDRCVAVADAVHDESR